MPRRGQIARGCVFRMQEFHAEAHPGFAFAHLDTDGDGMIEELKVHSTRLDSKLVEELEKSLTKSFYREKAFRS